jgi:methyl-accepting chemotaxis protein
LTNFNTLTRTISGTDASGNPTTTEEPYGISDDYRDAITAVMRGQAGTDIIEAEDGTSFISYQPIALPGYSDSWSVITLQNRAIAMAPVRQRTVSVVIIALVVAALAVIVMLFMTRRITTPIKDLSEKLSLIAVGNFGVNIATNERDEIGELSRDIMKVVEIFKNLISNLHHITEVHEKNGMTDERIDISRYEGAYAEVVSAFNNMLDYHVISKTEALECISGIVNGDFNATIRQFPGQESRINESVEGLRKNIREVVREISNVAYNANDGKMDYTIDISRYSGDWASLMHELNGIMTTVHEPITEMVRDIKAMEHGDFDARVKGDYKGDFLIIKNTLNSTISAVAGYVSDINGILSLLAAGNLKQSVTREYEGQFNSIKNSINMIITTLNDTMGNISDASKRVLSGAGQISGSSTELSSGASEQANAVLELNDVISKIESQFKETLNNALHATQLAITSKQNAETGNTEMQQLLTAMEGITDSSNKISKIIKTIQDIAFQTNLLALNAAVEAARAGEQGKGFAVVAAEVRNLASRSDIAARETSALIQESIDRVDIGKKRAVDTAESLKKIVENVTNMSDVINTIEKSSTIQSEALVIASADIEKISQVAQSSSSISQESTATSEELYVQAEMLEKMIGFFKMK